MCSIERKPSERQVDSFAVTSFWKSTKAFTRSGERSCGKGSRRPPPGVLESGTGACTGSTQRRPPHRAPLLRRRPRPPRSSREAEDAAASASRAFPLGADAGNKGMRPRRRARPAARWEKRWTRRREAAGHQHEVAGDAPALADPSVALAGRDVDADTRCLPTVRKARLQAGCGVSAARARSTHRPEIRRRRSRMAAISTPASARSSAATDRRSSCAVDHHRARTGLDAVARDVLAAASASMMPGRSLSGKRAGARWRRSRAPPPGAHLPQPLARRPSTFAARWSVSPLGEAEVIVRRNSRRPWCAGAAAPRDCDQVRHGVGEPCRCAACRRSACVSQGASRRAPPARRTG